MKAGTKVELPLWLGEMLAVAGRYVLNVVARGDHAMLFALLMLILYYSSALYKDSDNWHENTCRGKVATG